MAAKKPPKPPADLLDAFRVEADNNVAAVAVLLIDDGFDAAVMRVLASWTAIYVGWKRPSSKRPDDGAPTGAAWRWMVTGIEYDLNALADAAGCSRAMAVRSIDMLLANKLALPDGSISRPARAALQQHARQALGLKPAKEKAAAKKPDDEAN